MAIVPISIIFCFACANETQPIVRDSLEIVAEAAESPRIKRESAAVNICPHNTDALTAQISAPHEQIPEMCYTESDVEMLARLIYAEARGCSKIEQAAVVWCVLNRVDSDDPYYPNTIEGVVTQSNQFAYSLDYPLWPDLIDLARDVLNRWESDVGRVLPKEYLWFTGDGTANYFRTEYAGGTVWDWSLPDVYGDGL